MNLPFNYKSTASQCYLVDYQLPCPFLVLLSLLYTKPLHVHWQHNWRNLAVMNLPSAGCPLKTQRTCGELILRNYNFKLAPLWSGGQGSQSYYCSVLILIVLAVVSNTECDVIWTTCAFFLRTTRSYDAFFP